ncbi:hypothetical protein DFH09DRAFT_1159742, partial [Mycena vulgaris]
MGLILILIRQVRRCGVGVVHPYRQFQLGWRRIQYRVQDNLRAPVVVQPRVEFQSLNQGGTGRHVHNHGPNTVTQGHPLTVTPFQPRPLTRSQATPCVLPVAQLGHLVSALPHMSAATPFLTAISSTLPTGLSESLAEFQSPAAAQVLDTLIRFLSGGDSPDPEAQQQWSERQHGAMTALGALTKSSSTNGKRQREQDNDSDSQAKRQKTDPIGSPEDGPALFTLHAISTTSPIRKKVDIAVHASSVQFLNPSTRAIESSIPLSTLTRAFLLPTRGKMKAHWTVVILSSDTPDRGKKPAAQSSSPQIIFGLDATASAAVKYTSGTELNALKAGTPTRAILLDFLGRLPFPVLEPVSAVFKSACAGVAASASEGGVPGVEAYRAAKAGTLWFLRDGVLWGESKPCEFWPLESLLS